MVVGQDTVPNKTWLLIESNRLLDWILDQTNMIIAAAQSLTVYNQWQLRCAFSWLKHCPDVHHRFALRGAFLKWLMLNQPRKILQLGKHYMRIFGVAQIQGQHWWAFSGWKRYAEMDADHMVVVRQLPEQSTCFLLWTMRVIKFYKIRKMVNSS